MKTTICIIVVSTACIGCNGSPDSASVSSTPAPSTGATQAALPTATATVDTFDPKWREILFEDAEQLSNVPEIAVTSTDGDLIRVTAKNVGTTTLQYYSAGAQHVQLFQEVEDTGRWTQSSWDWCGTGKELFEIAPGESVELVVEFWDGKKRERMLANFSEKDTNRSALVVLAIEPDR